MNAVQLDWILYYLFSKVFKEKDTGSLNSGFLEIRMSRKRSEHEVLLRRKVLMDLEVLKKRGIKKDSKQKVDKWDFIKNLNFCATKDNQGSEKTVHRMGENRSHSL